jgi:two-component system nitrogen regulation response regulator NtrX
LERLLVIDDDPRFASDLQVVLGDNYRIESALTSADGLRCIAREAFDAVLLDIDLGEEIDGLAVLRKVRELDSDLPVIMVSRTDDPSVVVTAGQQGASDFIAKGDSVDSLCFRLRKALEERILRMREELRSWRQISEGDEWLGESESAKEVSRQIEKLAATTSPVLVTGPTGAGKEVVARTLHARSPRSGGPFVAVNCAAIPESLAESTLFGHDKGAFTGADSRRRGCFELSHGGTLLLDEFTEMQPDLQPKLLRILERGELQRVGSEQTRAVDIRIVAATNRNVEECLRSGKLREDIYYRLSTLEIRVPSLRERLPDILPLARKFATARARKDGKAPPGISDGAAAVLQSYDWPGNVRELRNVLERAVVFCEGDTLEPEHLTGLRDGFRRLALPYEAAREAAISRFERDYVHSVLTLTGGNVSVAAKRMNMSRQGLHKILRKHGIEPERFRG